MLDLLVVVTTQVTVLKERPEAIGSYNEIYLGTSMLSKISARCQTLIFLISKVYGRTTDR
jgi:hypothetical protein